MLVRSICALMAVATLFASGCAAGPRNQVGREVDTVQVEIDAPLGAEPYPLVLHSQAELDAWHQEVLPHVTHFALGVDFTAEAVVVDTYTSCGKAHAFVRAQAPGEVDTVLYDPEPFAPDPDCAALTHGP